MLRAAAVPAATEEPTALAQSSGAGSRIGSQTAADLAYLAVR